MNDDFTTAREETAEAAADLWTRQQGYAMTGTEWGAFEQGYLTGSAWARAHLAAQEPTDREVQEAATALLAFIHNEPVERIREVYGVLDRDGHWSTQARAALSASRAARLDEEKR